MQHYLGVAEEMRITERELDTIQAVAMSMSACRVRSQFGEVKNRTDRENSTS
jgi:hypothetical protein